MKKLLKIVSAALILCLVGCTAPAIDEAKDNNTPEPAPVAAAPAPTPAPAPKEVPAEAPAGIKLSPKQLSIEKANILMLAESGNEVNKFFIDDRKNMFVDQDKYTDHRIFGFAKPDITSKRMLLVSAYTTDVEGNPFECPLGAFYATEDMGGASIKFVGKKGNFVEADVVDPSGEKTTVFFEAKWVAD